MSESLNAPNLEPQIAARGYDALLVDPTLEQLSQDKTGGIHLNIADSKPLATEALRPDATLAMLYSIDADGQRYQVWGGLQEDGRIYDGATMITHDDFNPKAPTNDPRSWRISLSVKQPVYMHLPTGKPNTFVRFHLDSQGLLLSAPNNSMHVLAKTMPTSGLEAETEIASDDSLWTYTTYGSERAELRKEAEREAGHMERQTISRDSSVLEGVYEGSYGGEAIVVDYDEDPELIDAAVAGVLTAATDPLTGKIDKHSILDGVYNLVSDKMQYNSAAVDEIFQDTLKGVDGSKISLSHYIELGVGECRHQALFATAILELISKQGILGGKTSIDRNMVKSGPDGKYDGHAWARYANSAGQVFIIDIAQQKIGTIQEMMAAHSKDPSNNWDYARPEDKQFAVGKVTTQALGILPSYDKTTYTNDQGVIDRLPWATGSDDDKKTT